MSGVETPSLPLFATTVCPNCGYSLLGLAEAGTCPECGFNYDQSEIIHYGFGRGRHENVLNAKKSRIAWVLFVSTFYILVQLPSLIDSHKTLTVVLALVAGPNIYRLLRRQDTRHPGQVQVRLSKPGFVQYDDLNGLNAVDQLWQSHGWLLPAGAAVTIGVMLYLAYWNSAKLWAWFLISLLLAIISTFSSRNYRRKARQVLPGAIAEANRAFHPIRSWALAREWSLTWVAEQRYRIQIDVRNMRRFSEREEVVDAEIQCTTDQATFLRQQITDWIAETKGKDNDKLEPSDSTKRSLTK